MSLFGLKKRKKEEKKEVEREEKGGGVGLRMLKKVGIFKHEEEKKEIEETKKMEEPPEFPELAKKAGIPSYKPKISPTEAETIKEAVTPPIEEMPKPPKIEQAHKVKRLEEEEEIEEEKPIFIKIEEYRDVMKTIKDLKHKMKEADDILHALNKIKKEEDEELKNWHDELITIKEKLTSIDKTLFEV